MVRYEGMLGLAATIWLGGEATSRSSWREGEVSGVNPGTSAAGAKTRSVSASLRFLSTARLSASACRESKSFHLGGSGAIALPSPDAVVVEEREVRYSCVPFYFVAVGGGGGGGGEGGGPVFVFG